MSAISLVVGGAASSEWLRCWRKAETDPYTRCLLSNCVRLHARRLRDKDKEICAISSRTRYSRPICKAGIDDDRQDSAVERDPLNVSDESTGFKPDEAATSSTGIGAERGSNLGPTRNNNRIVAVASIAAAVSFFLVNRGLGLGPNLSELAASALPYEEALKNGKPTVVEFYADWCEICREMARDVYSVEQEYKDNVNFVMLNVDNNKWEAELDEFGVEGIPHFAFLDDKGNEEGNVVGRLPRKYLFENVAALARGEAKIPHSRIFGQFSSADSRQAPAVIEPRSHGR